MRIVYVGKFDQLQSNDDEGAILHALRELGHDVQPVREHKGISALTLKGDLLLFHHWDKTEVIKKFNMPKAFWYFDLVDWPADPTLKARCDQRKAWMERTIPVVDFAFMTDGDYGYQVSQTPLGMNKVYHLMQGADERVMGIHASQSHCIVCKQAFKPDILMVGGVQGCGVQRRSFVEEMHQTYGDRFVHIQKGVYRRELGGLIANTKIVVAPDSPVTDRYWSNRVYIMLGFGAFLIHPYAKGLAEQFGDSVGLMCYHNRKQLHEWINDYTHLEASRKIIAHNGFVRIQLEHTYRHRVQTMMGIITRKLGIQ